MLSFCQFWAQIIKLFLIIEYVYYIAKNISIVCTYFELTNITTKITTKKKADIQDIMQMPQLIIIQDYNFSDL